MSGSSGVFTACILVSFEEWIKPVPQWPTAAVYGGRGYSVVIGSHTPWDLYKL
jgi:hypothetical protein